MSNIVTDDELRAILSRNRRIAIVGLSNNPMRPSYGVARYLIRQGYEVVGVNPNLAGQEVLGRPVYASLADLPRPPEIVDVFRRSVFVPEVVGQAIAAGAKVIWTQLGVKDDEAAARARAAGLAVVQNRCTAIEHERLGVGAVV